jgi:CheY-like chemotaxis protein
MPAAPLPPDEAQRLNALDSYAVLDSAAEPVFDDLTALAAGIVGTPIALISLIDATRQWFKSAHGLGARETSRDVAFCAHAILQSAPLIVPDARVDERFADNPLVTGEPQIRFYAGTPLIDSHGHALGTLCVIDQEPRQITDQQTHDLQRLARQVVGQLELRRSRERLNRVNSAHKRLIAAFDDDVTLASRGIARSTELLLRSSLSDEQRALASAIQQCGDHLVSLIGGVLEYDRLESSEIRLVRRPLSVVAVASDAAAACAVDAHSRQLVVDLQYALCDRHLRLGDARRLGQAVGFVIASAVEHAGSGVITVNIEADPHSSTVTYEVIDNGRSSARPLRYPHDAEAARAPGYRGAGLGLAIARRVVALMGGHTGVRRNNDGDIVFWLSVPLPKASAAVAAQTVAVQAAEPGDLNVLVAEENEVVRLLVASLLQRLGCSVTVVDSAASALEALQHACFDAVLVDCDAGGVDAFALTRSIRGRETHSSGIAIIALSAGPLDAERDQCLRAGMSDLLCLATLGRNLQAALRRLTT